MKSQLAKRIALHEGYRKSVYKCSEGHDTIGIGFKIADLELDEDVCEIILMRKLQAVHYELAYEFKWYPKMPPEIRDVMVECSYQMGTKGWTKFKKANKYLSEENWEKAGDEMLDSKWARQTPKRARTLADIVKNYNNKGESK